MVVADRLLLDGAPVGSSRHPGFVPHGAYHDPDRPHLNARLRAAGVRRVRITAPRTLAVLELVEILADLRDAGVAEWALVIDGRAVGRYRLFDGDADLAVSDLYLGPSTAARRSASELGRRGAGARSRIELVVGFDRTLGELRAVLARADGRGLRLRFHLGPY